MRAREYIPEKIWIYDYSLFCRCGSILLAWIAFSWDGGLCMQRYPTCLPVNIQCMPESLPKSLFSLLPYSVQNSLKRSYNAVMRDKIIAKWKKAGSPVPPPHAVKQAAIAEYALRSGYEILVETGTFRGEMILSHLHTFRRIYSIELSTQLWKNAVRRFRNHKHVILLQGDSADQIGPVVAQLDKPAIFWLDGHYSGGITARGVKISPILQEINTILAQKEFNHILLIDDARLFTGKGYPTIDELTEYVRSKDPRYAMENRDDIVRFTIQERSFTG